MPAATVESDAKDRLGLEVGRLGQRASGWLFSSCENKGVSMSKHPSAAIEAVLAKVEADEKVMLGLAANMIKAYGGAIYGFDFLAIGAANRSLALSAGFCSMIRERNLICAGALLRLQLDTSLRMFAGFIVENPHEFAIAVLDGKRIPRMKDRYGNLMTDRHLVIQLAEEYPFVQSVYDKTSDYVHMSGTHIHSTLEDMDGDQHEFSIKIGSRDKIFSDTVYIDAVNTFRECTKILARYLEGWTWTKNNPEKVTQLKEHRESTEPLAHGGKHRR